MTDGSDECTVGPSLLDASVAVGIDVEDDRTRDDIVLAGMLSDADVTGGRGVMDTDMIL